MDFASLQKLAEALLEENKALQRKLAKAEHRLFLYDQSYSMTHRAYNGDEVLGP